MCTHVFAEFEGHDTCSRCGRVGQICSFKIDYESSIRQKQPVYIRVKRFLVYCREVLPLRILAKIGVITDSFLEIESRFYLKPRRRKYFFSKTFILYKICAVLGYDLNKILGRPALRSVARLRDQENLFQEIYLPHVAQKEKPPQIVNDIIIRQFMTFFANHEGEVSDGKNTSAHQSFST